MSLGSRPIAAHCASRTAALRRSVSMSPLACQMSACLATMGRVFFSPLPPINSGIFLTGGGLRAPSRRSIRGRAAASRSRRLPAVPKS